MRRHRASRRLLMLAPGSLGARLAGPEIRALELAKSLSARYAVTLAAPCGTDGERDGIRVIASSRRRLVREAARHDVIFSACIPPYLLALRPLNKLVAIADLYDPYEQELATLEASPERERETRRLAAIQAYHLRHADLVLCASGRQRERLLDTADAVLGAGVRRPDPVVVPFGISDPPAPLGRRPLRGLFPQIAPGDTVVLWWGSVWRWLDAETAVRAFARIAAVRRDVKLVITAGRSPNNGTERAFDATEEVRALAAELGVLGRTVFFLDEWIPYQERHDYLREADIGITLHRNGDEARLAARARYMDYLSAELPCVLGRGDETAEDFGASGFATLLAHPGPDALAAALLALADSPRKLEDARAAGRRLAAERQWDAIGSSLRYAVEGVFARRASHEPGSLALLGDTGAFYARRILDMAVAGGGWTGRRAAA